MNTTTTKKPSKGRKKIDIKRIEALNHRQVTFSKRRAGLFKKSGELCVLTGAHAAVIVNSPGGRLFAFGHPSVDTVIDRYLNNNNNNNNVSTSLGLVDSQVPPPVVAEFNRRYAAVVKELEAEKRRRAVVVRRTTVADGGGLRWFEEEDGGMEVEELQENLTSLVELRRKVVVRADELVMIRKTPVIFGRKVYGNGGGGGGGGVTPVGFDYDIGVNDVREGMHY